MPLSGDQLARLYDRWAEQLLVFLVRRTSDPEGAVDLLAETFASAFEDRAQFRGADDDAARAWLYGIARHELADYFRHEQARRRASNRLGLQRRALSDDEYERIEELASSCELRRHVAHLLERLPRDQRAAVRLRVIDGYSYASVARVLEITTLAARARVSRGLRALAADIDRAFDSDSPQYVRSIDRV